MSSSNSYDHITDRFVAWAQFQSDVSRQPLSWVLAPELTHLLINGQIWTSPFCQLKSRNIWELQTGWIASVSIGLLMWKKWNLAVDARGALFLLVAQA